VWVVVALVFIGIVFRGGRWWLGGVTCLLLLLEQQIALETEEHGLFDIGRARGGLVVVADVDLHRYDGVVSMEE